MNSTYVEDRNWLKAAIELSRQSRPTPTNYAVGAIIVDNRGLVISTGYTGEIGPRDHAEEVALEKLAHGSGIDLSQATVYSSLEPCTTRKSRPGTCTELILAAGIKRVVFALPEPPIFADCHGVEILRNGGAEVLAITELAPLVAEVNAHILELKHANGCC
jgi:diaminohydroxyphosphoribosylaminopyrimidine deaminase/5-amino-6-(5-phosphoribosylamino)uracil reductase